MPSLSVMTHFDQVRAIAYYTCLEARRNHLLWVVVLTIFAAVGLAGFLGQVAITETRQIQAAFLGALLRWAAVFIVSLTVITGMVREFNDKSFELVLSLPLPRAGYFFGKLSGYAVVAVLVAACMTFPLLLVVPPAQATLWGVSLGCELLLVCALSLLCMLTLKQTLPAFAVVTAFYLLARSISAIQLMGQGPLVDAASWSQKILTWLVDTIALVLPNLDRFTATDWLVYHSGGPLALAPIFGQSLVYLTLLAGAGLFDLYRKNL
mgnify:CR=1 FL=1